MSNEQRKARVYLEQFEISHNKYIIGVFEPGISIKKQQVRAINVFDALVKSEVLNHNNDSNISIGVIGGGVAGITFASAALKCDYEVHLFEEQSSLLHLQELCYTRRIYPHVTEWPEKFRTPYAELPFLAWKQDIAHNVAVRLVKEFKFITGQSLLKEPQSYKEHLSSKVENIYDDDGKIKVVYRSKFGQKTVDVDLVILAIGYGTERGIQNGAIPYWRNEAIDQTYISNNTKGAISFLISGTGDGGLIDMFRIAIKDFKYEIFFDAIDSSPENSSLLYEKLRRIHEDASKGSAANFVYKQFEKLKPDIDYILEYINMQNLKREYDILLTGEKNLGDIFDIRFVTYLNSFIAYVLHCGGYYNYSVGKLDLEKREFNGEKLPKEVQIIPRHGTDVKKVLQEIQMSADEKKRLTDLEIKQNKQYSYGRIDQRWQYHEIMKLFNNDNTRRFEFINPEITHLFTTYIRRLSSNLHHLSNSSDFKISIHRLLDVDDVFYYQQVTPYSSPRGLDYKNLGQIFNYDRGNVGYSIATQQATLVKRINEEEFANLAVDLNLGKNYPHYKFGRSFFSLPIVTNANGKSVTNLVVHIDSQSPKFFTKKIIDAIILWNRDFVNTLNEKTPQSEVEFGRMDDFLKTIKKSPQFKSGDYGGCWFDCDEINKRNVYKLNKFTYFEHITIN